jgi:hypothetical protein
MPYLPPRLFYITDNPYYIDFQEQPWSEFAIMFYNSEIITTYVPRNEYNNEDDYICHILSNHLQELSYTLSDYASINRHDYIIVDIYSKLNEEICNTLYETFNSLEGNQIMFINETDEVDMQHYSEEINDTWDAFLDYVDIHINKNHIQWFLANVINEFYAYETGITPDNNGYSYIIFDESLSNEQTLEIILSYLWGSSGPMFNFEEIEHIAITRLDIICYILHIKYNIIPIFSNYNGNFLWCVSSYGNYGSIGFDSINDFSHYHGGEKVAAVGTTWLGDVDNDSEFFELMHDCQNQFVLRNQNYILIQNGSYEDSGYANYVGMDNATYDYWLHWILRDFFDEYSLFQYDNWQGRCDVTFRIPYGVDTASWDIQRDNFDSADLCLCSACACTLADSCNNQLHCDYCYWH